MIGVRGDSGFSVWGSTPTISPLAALRCHPSKVRIYHHAWLRSPVYVFTEVWRSAPLRACNHPAHRGCGDIECRIDFSRDSDATRRSARAAARRQLPVGRCLRIADAGRGRALHGSATRVDNSSDHHRRVPLVRRRGLLPSRDRSRRGVGDVGSCRAHFSAGLRGEVRHPRGRRVQLPERHHRSQHADGRQRHRRHNSDRDRRRQDQWLRLPQRSRSLLGRKLQLPRRTAGSSVAASGGELHHPRRSPAAQWGDRLALGRLLECGRRAAGDHGGVQLLVPAVQDTRPRHHQLGHPGGALRLQPQQLHVPCRRCVLVGRTVEHRRQLHSW